MPTPKKGARLGGSASHQKKILANLAVQLFMNEKIVTTQAKAKMLRPYAEKIITKAKGGTIADRRNVNKLIQDKDVIFHLFHELAPQFEGRDGGYTRMIKLENRRGDNAPMVQVSLVLEPTVSTEAERTTRAAAAKQDEAPAEDTKADEAQAEEAAEAAATDDSADKAE